MRRAQIVVIYSITSLARSKNDEIGLGRLLERHISGFAPRGFTEER
ncbi:MAG TPA: hypothetical protein VKP67_29480 [Xanthobacteraceae bacterium]|nr:hypothetical protein [Xanthobacteraceae bacterium]